jgi:hypothetical protein
VKLGDLVRINDMPDLGIVLEIWIGTSPSRRVDECDDNDCSGWIECLWTDGIDGISADEVMVINEAR